MKPQDHTHDVFAAIIQHFSEGADFSAGDLLENVTDLFSSEEELQQVLDQLVDGARLLQRTEDGRFRLVNNGAPVRHEGHHTDQEQSEEPSDEDASGEVPNITAPDLAVTSERDFIRILRERSGSCGNQQCRTLRKLFSMYGYQMFAIRDLDPEEFGYRRKNNAAVNNMLYPAIRAGIFRRLNEHGRPDDVTRRPYYAFRPECIPEEWKSGDEIMKPKESDIGEGGATVDVAYHQGYRHGVIATVRMHFPTLPTAMQNKLIAQVLKE